LSHPRFSPSCVLITGASGAIGSALALDYARSGCRTLLLQGRDGERLRSIAAACTAHGARVVTQVLDLRDLAALQAWLADLSLTDVPDLVIVNAGVNISSGAQGESWDAVQDLFAVNVTAALATVHGVLPAMRARGQGQIALISSLAAWRGLPATPSYSASKAALKVYGEALRETLAAEGVRINVVMPGYVASDMCTAMPGPKPWLWSADKAARAIRRGLQANRARISFPFPLNLGCFLLSVLPPALSGRMLAWLGYRA